MSRVHGWWGVASEALFEPLVWHAFAGDDAQSVPSRCSEVTLPVECVGELETVAHGRPYVACLLDAAAPVYGVPPSLEICDQCGRASIGERPVNSGPLVRRPPVSPGPPLFPASNPPP